VNRPQSGRDVSRLAGLLLAAVLATGAAHAQPGGPGPGSVPRPAAAAPQPQLAIDALGWTAVRGTAIDLSVGADGTAFALDQERRVWRRLPGPRTESDWMLLPGSFTRIDAAARDLAVAITSAGDVHLWNGTLWRPIDQRARDVAIAPDGRLLVADIDGRMLAAGAGGTGFRVLAGADAPRDAVRVELEEGGVPWALDSAGRVHVLRGSGWQVLPGQARDLSLGPRGIVYIVDAASGQPARWNQRTLSWNLLDARAKLVAGGSGGQPWIMTPEGELFAIDLGRAATAAPTFNRSSFLVTFPGFTVGAPTSLSLAVSARGHAAVLDANGAVWQWGGQQQWRRLGDDTAFARVALDGAGRALALRSQGTLARWNGAQWVTVPGQAIDVAFSPLGAAWILLPDGSPAVEGPSGSWVSIDAPGDAVRLAIGQFNRPWVVGRDGQVRSHDGSGWKAWSGVVARDLAIGPGGTVFAASVEGRVLQLNPLDGTWGQVEVQTQPNRTPARVTAIAAGPLDKPWVIQTGGTTLASSLFEGPAVLADGGCTAEIGATRTIFQQPVPLPVVDTTPMQSLAIGRDGAVFALTTGSGELRQWSNGRSRFFNTYRLAFSQVAVAPNGTPWGVTSMGQVWRLSDSGWKVVVTPTLVARYIAVGCSGAVFVNDDRQQLWRYVPGLDRFERFSPAPQLGGTRLAVEPSGVPWTLRNNVVLRCEDGRCDSQYIGYKEALDIAFGPEGTLAVIALNGDVEAWDAKADPPAWRKVGFQASSIAIGPTGLPWLVQQGNGQVFSTAFFQRNEERDAERAAATPALASNSDTPPPFQFLISIPFDRVALPPAFALPAFPPPVQDVHLAFAPNGRLVVKDVGYHFWIHDGQQFTRDNTIPNPSAPAVLNGDAIRSFVIGQDGTYWITNDGTVPKIWRRQTAGWQQVPIPADCPTTPGCAFPSAISVNVGPDGTVYATGEANNLYRYDTVQQRFVPLTTVTRPPGGAAFVAVSPPAAGGRFWIASPGVGSLFELVGSTWVRRTDTVIGPPGQCFTGATPCVSFAGTGAAFGLGAVGQLVRFNGGGWERATSSPLVGLGSTYIGAPDGRAWIWTGATGSPPNALFRAR
jgi:hypothetical protein